MKFGIFYELQLPRPWLPGGELQLYQNALDQVEDVGAFLVAHGIAEDAPEQPDVVPQPSVFFERRGFLGSAGFELGLGRHDLG